MPRHRASSLSPGMLITACVMPSVMSETGLNIHAHHVVYIVATCRFAADANRRLDVIEIKVLDKMNASNVFVLRQQLHQRNMRDCSHHF